MYGPNLLPGSDLYSPWAGESGVADPEALAPHYDAVFLNAPKQAEETRGLLALALQRSRGLVMAVAANDAGGKRLARLFAAHGLTAHTLAKHRCTIAWTQEARRAAPETLAAELSLLAPRMVEMGGRNWWTVPGIFGWDKLDAGSVLLLDSLPRDIAGNVADFGCGFGYLSAELERRYPTISMIDAFDADARAVAALCRNTGERVNGHWQDIKTLAARPVYDTVVMNPPFHQGKAQDIGLGECFIRKAWECLRAGGRLFLVANRHLPYEHAGVALRVLREEQGFKIMMGVK